MMAFFNIVCSAFVFLLCFICWDRLRKGSATVPLLEADIVCSKKYYALLLAVAGFALFVRLYQFGSVPVAVWNDGAMAAVDAKALAEYGTDRFGMKYPVHLTAWGYGQMSSLLSYLMVPFIKLFGFSETVVRLPSLIVSLLGLIFLYLFVRSAFNRNCALVVLAFAAICPWHIIQSRWALDCNLYAHFFLCGIYLLHEGVTKKKPLVFLSMVIFGLSMYCYGTSVYTMPVFLVAACVYLLITKKVKALDVVWCVLIYLAVSWPFYAVMVVNFFKLETIEILWFTIPYFPDSVRSKDILFFSDNFLADFGSNVFYTFIIVFQIMRDELLNMIPHFGTMYVFSVPLMLLGAYQLVKHTKESVGAVFCLMFFGTGVFSGLMTHGVNVWRINVIFYSMVIMIGVGIYSCLRIFKKVRWVVVPIYLLAVVWFFGAYLTTHQASVGYPYYPGFCQALVETKDADIDKFYVSNRTLADTVHFRYDRSEILTMFYHEVDSQEYYGIGQFEGEVPGKERYVFAAFDEPVVPSGENAVYILHKNELLFFDPKDFALEQYGTFYLAVPLVD